MNTFKKQLSLALATLTLLSVTAVFSACGETTEDPIDTKGEVTQGSANETEGETEDTRFDGVNYNGRPFRILTSTNVASAGMGNSNPMIEGDKELVGDKINEAVLERNKAVEELLGVQLEFTQLNVDYNGVPTEIRKLTSSGLDEYDLVINDLFPCADLSIEGHFRNTLSSDCVFDFDRDYWYGDYMSDLRLEDGYQYLLAGDYFIDIMRSAHLLLVNKDIYLEFYKTSADELYDVVLNYEWTFDKLTEVISDLYIDTNVSGSKDAGDRFGFLTVEPWGASIAHTVSGNPGFIARNENGIPSITLAEGSRAGDLANAMSTLLNNESTCMDIILEADVLQHFVEGEALVLDYQRLGSLENPVLRSMESDICVLPHPMLYASDKKYTTSTHDTSEVGVILTTSKDLEFISTVIEVLNRESAKIVIPKYYNEGLQITLVDDPKAAAMIDIIHDNFGNSFALAYNGTLGNTLLNPFCTAVQEKREFSAVYKSSDRQVKRNLQAKLKAFQKMIDKQAE